MHKIKILIFIFLHSVLSKKLTKIVSLDSLTNKPQTIFITKFDIGAGHGNITLKFQKVANEHASKSITLKVGILMDEQYPQFKAALSCQQRQKLYTQVQQLALSDSYRRTRLFQVDETVREHVWYVYLFNCQLQKESSKLSGNLQLDLIMYNNGSHFGEDEQFLSGYIVLVVIWIGLMIRFVMPIYRALKKSQGWTQLFIYGGFWFLGLAYFYRLLYLSLIYMDGEDLTLLYFLYTIIKHIVEGVLVTALVSIAWGWSLIHLKHDPTYIIVGVLVTIVNIIAMIIENDQEEIEEAHYQYDGMGGIILFILRTFIFLTFLVGVLRSRAESAGKIRFFLTKFGIRGGVYLVAWPAALVFSQLFLPKYMHQEVICLIEEGTHLVANAMMCSLFLYPNSEYKKVSRKDNSVLPSYFNKD